MTAVSAAGSDSVDAMSKYFSSTSARSCAPLMMSTANGAVTISVTSPYQSLRWFASSPGARVRPVTELGCDGQNAGPRLVGQRHGLPTIQDQRDRRARDTRVKGDVLHRDRAASRLRHERCFRVLGVELTRVRSCVGRD